MTESVFREYVAKYLSPVTARVYETLNDRPESSPVKLLHKEMLTPEQTMKDTWDSATPRHSSRMRLGVGYSPR